MDKKAYEITITSWPGMVTVIPEINAGKAKYLSYIHARDAGWDIPLIEFRARRAPARPGRISQRLPG